VSAQKSGELSSEDRLIAAFFRPLAGHPGALGLRDDAAFFTPPAGCDLVLTKDAIVSGVHFFEDDPPDLIARKALRVNLSDLAAKGAEPAGFLLALALHKIIDDAWLLNFSEGLAADAEAYGCPLFGGDTVRTGGPVMASVTAFGMLPHGSMVHRNGARPGDRVLVTGTIGDSALGLTMRTLPKQLTNWRLSPAHETHLLGRYLLPQPRTGLAQAVRSHASAAMDVSDGLVGDLGKLCRESGVSAEIAVPRIPLSAAVRAVIAAEHDMLNRALTGGDDYEILCTVAQADVPAFTAEAAAAGVPVAEIGRVVAGSAPPRFADAGGDEIEFEHGSYSHF
jgi:thiamine-monophosphate kinase